MSNVVPIARFRSGEIGAIRSSSGGAPRYSIQLREEPNLLGLGGDVQLPLVTKVTSDALYRSFVTYHRGYGDVAFATMNSQFGSHEQSPIQGVVVTDKNTAPLNTFLTVTVPILGALVGVFGVGWGAFQHLDNGIEEARLEAKSDMQRASDKLESRFDRLEIKVDRILELSRK